MSYTIKRYGQPNIILPNGAINSETSVTLIGKNYASYGQLLDQNSMTLLQNSAGDSPPTNPQYGQLWYDASTKALKVYTGTTFKPLGSVVASPLPPSNPVIGDLWFNTSDETLNVFNGSTWIVVGPSTVRGTGVIAATILDTIGVTHSVVQVLINKSIVGIINKDPTFVPKTPIPGFETVGPGYNVASTVNSVTQYFQGIATDSLALGGQPANAFMAATGSNSRVDFTGGLFADYLYANAYAGNVVTLVNTGAGLTGGPISTTGTISIANAKQANSSALYPGAIGGVIPDGSTITINPNAVITALGNPIGKPIIQSFSPNSGTTNGGTMIFVTGQFFTAASAVTVAGVPAAHWSVTSNNQIVIVTAAASGATSGPITITTPGGTTSSTTSFSYTVVPVITNFTPVTSPITGNTTVFITGENLINVSSVSLAGIPVTSFTAHKPTLVSALSAPTANQANGPIKIVTGGGTALSEEIFEYTLVDNSPTIGNISPTFGPVEGGTVITITGTNLSTVFAVSVDGIMTQKVNHVSDSEVQATTSPGVAGSGEVMVYSVHGTAMSTQHFTYTTNSGAPTITFISPIAGPVAGGTAVTIAGTNLNSVTAVSIAGVNAASFSITSSTQIVAITGAATQAGAGYIQLQSPLGGVISSMAFTYYNNADEPVISHIAPQVGPLGGGQQVLIQGQNFQSELGVSIISSVIIATIAAVQVAVKDDGNLSAVTSAVGAATTGRVLISGAFGSATSAQFYTYDAVPVIANFSPTSGPTSGNTPIIVVGEDLIGVSTATVAGTSIADADVTVINDTIVELNSPAHAAGSGVITVTNLAGTGTSTQQYTYASNTGGGTVTSVAVGAGLNSSTSPSPITTSGTISLAKAVQQVGSTGGTLGGVIPDGTSIVIDSYGVISAATSGGGTVSSITVGNGLVGSPNPITTRGNLSLATAVAQTGGAGGTLGGVIPDGTTITITGSGVISASLPGNANLQSLGVGTAASGVAGEIRATNNITAWYSSDIRLKENFELISDPLEKAKVIRGYFFDWKDSFIAEHGGEDGKFITKHNVGLKAQEVQKVLPEVVTEREDGYLAVRYEMLIPLLFECINTLINKLESK